MIKDDKTIGYILMAVIVYQVLQTLMPFLMLALVALGIWSAIKYHRGR